jgi:hypothetical protein
MQKSITLLSVFLSLSLFMLSSASAEGDSEPGDGNRTLVEECTALCGEYEAATIDIDAAGNLVACTCDVTDPSRVCCTQGTSVPCGDACIPEGRTCSHVEDGRASYCDIEISGPNVEYAAECAVPCSPYTVGTLKLGTDGALVACGCHVSSLAPVCCTPGTSRPCGDACISPDHNCQRPTGRAMFCDPDTEQEE